MYAGNSTHGPLHRAYRLACLLAGLAVTPAWAGGSASVITGVDPDPAIPLRDGSTLAQIQLTFDGPIVVDADAFRAFTIDQANLALTVDPADGVTTTQVTLTMTGVSANRVTLVVDNTGGESVFQYTILQGDVTADGITDGDDFEQVSLWASGECPADPRCQISADDADLDGDNTPDLDDVMLVQGGLGSCLPSACPAGNPRAAADGDEDGAGDAFDNCPVTVNSGQFDRDDDGAGDACDGCTDADNDGFGSGANGNSGCATSDTDCDDSPGNDADPDADNACGATDNCPDDANADQADADTDGAGDVCDPCTDVDGDDFGDGSNGNIDCAGGTTVDCDDTVGNTADPDFDNVCGATDNCPDDANADQADGNTNGIGDACDPDGSGAGGGGDDGVNSLMGSGFVDNDGRFSTEARDTLGALFGAVSLTDANPGELVTWNLFDAINGLSSAPGQGIGTRFGFPLGRGIGRTFVVTTTATPGSFVTVISLTFTLAELEMLGFEPENLEMYVLATDVSPQRWIPAGTNELFDTPPTGRVGDTGYVINGDGTVTFWVVRDQLSVYAVGQRTIDPAPDEGDGSDDGMGGDDGTGGGDGGGDDRGTDDGSMTDGGGDDTGTNGAPDPDLPLDEAPDEALTGEAACGGGMCGAMGTICFTLLFVGLGQMKYHRRRLARAPR